MSPLSSFITRYNIIKQIPVFSRLNWFDIQRIARRGIIAEYKKGAVIRKEGDPPDFFYCLISGRLQTYTINKNGLKDNVDFIHRGQHFGIISVFTGEAHSQNFEAINDSIVLQIPREDFLEILKVVPQLGIQFSELLSKWMRRKVKGDPGSFDSKIISVYSPKTETGNSTYAMNLALSLEKETRKKVIFLSIQSQREEIADTDKGTSALKPLWKQQAWKLHELANEPERIQSAIVGGELPVDLLRAAFEPPIDISLTKRIAPFVTSLLSVYHYVIVDLPNEMDDVVQETLLQSDLVHLVTRDHKEDLDSVRRVIDNLEANLKAAFREDKIRVIVSTITAEKERTLEEISKTIDYSVTSRLPFIPESELRLSMEAKDIHFLQCPPESAYAKVVRRTAREIGGVLVGLSLGGGAALGIAHIGILKVFEAEKIPVDVVSGSSMGALIAAFWAAGYSAVEIEKIAQQFKHKLAIFKLLDLNLPISGFVSGRAIRRWLRKYLGDKTFYSTRIPLKIVSYDLMRREELVIESGKLVDAIMQSIAIPGVIDPVRQGERVIIDGGVLNPLPTNVLGSLGIKKIVSVNVLQSPDDIVKGYELHKRKTEERDKIPFWKAPISFIAFRVGKFFHRRLYPNISDIIVLTLQAAEYVIAEQSAQNADVAIHPDVVGIEWYELHKVDQLIARGEAAARNHLANIKELITE
jgi:predicted acylesterase/phospholipase RssA/Mrp family chromosome partitioning ATPase